MNRTHIKPKKKSPDVFLIEDRLDGKKLGRIRKKNGVMHIKLRKKYRNKGLKEEVLHTFDQQPGQWIKVYHRQLKHINRRFMNIDGYHFPMFSESCRLKYSGKDMFDRPAYLHPAARKAWKKMRNAARADNIDLQIVSAYRSIEYQKQLIQKKIDKGINIKDIIKVSALPGFSEHHTGCAIDIGSHGASVLEESFEKSMAFIWLMGNADTFGFYLTYPRNNKTGITYEPWHWCYQKGHLNN